MWHEALQPTTEVLVSMMAKHREKVTITEPVQGTTASGKLNFGTKAFHHRLPFFTGHKTKTISLGVHFTGPENQDEAELEKTAQKAKFRSLESSPEKDSPPTRSKIDSGSTGSASHNWLRKQKSIGPNMQRNNTMELQPTSKSKKVKFPAMKKSAS